MNQEIKQKWIEALESGKYQQGTGMLKYYDKVSHRTKHCCLGVLCEVYQQEVGDLVIEKVSYDSNATLERKRDKVVHYFDDNSGPLPDAVADWAGISTYGSYGVGQNLASDNDEGATFKEIAQTIGDKF